MAGLYSVDDILKMSISNVSELILKHCNFSNDEIKDLILRTEHNYANGKVTMYRNLVKSYTGTFNREVFNLLVKHMLKETFGSDLEYPMLLLEKSTGLDDDDKKEWFKYASQLSGSNSSMKFVMGFVETDSKKFGMDISQKPWNGLFPLSLLQYVNFNEEALRLIALGLDTLTDSEKMEWYEYAVKHVHEFNMRGFITGYEGNTEEILTDYFENYTEGYPDLKVRIAKHPNAPKKVKMEMFRITKDIEFLPPQARNYFDF